MRLLLIFVMACASHPNQIHGAWSEPVDPVHIIGNLHYVGAKNIASYLITTPAGHILIDTGTREMIPIVRRNIEKLGFAVRDIKILLCSHAHYDHVQGHAAIQQASGARVMVMRGDDTAVASGIDQSPFAGEGWDPVRVDRILEDNDTVELGGTTLQAIAAPGHTPGCTVWTTRIATREVVIYGCMRPNDGVQLTGNPRFPHLVDQTRATFRRMRALAPDLTLTTHPDAPFAARIDPAAWPKLLDEAEAEFAQQLRNVGP
ncbi:MAG: subclass B3 metallo-beta-lactamase [Kofleriaceae bacterium]